MTTLWSLLERAPNIIVQNNSLECWELAQKLQNDINKLQNELNSGLQVASDNKSVILIMDRGMDLVAPLVHDITFQVLSHTLQMLINFTSSCHQLLINKTENSVSKGCANKKKLKKATLGKNGIDSTN